MLERERLSLSRLESSGTQIIALLAPTGFGKTSQLAQWRRQSLTEGCVPIWYSADGLDEPMMLVRGLALSAQNVCGKRAFGDSFMRWLDTCSEPQEAMTGWLAELVDVSVEVLLLLDDADQLPTATRNELLPYLLGNAPANLRIALAARPTAALMASGSLSIAPIVRVTASDLRLRLDETMAVLSSTLGARCNPETAVHLQELTEGWPLGVQLAAASLHRGDDLEGLLASATADIQRYFVDKLIDHQPEEAIYLLVRLAQFELIHPNLCKAALAREDLGAHLLRLQDETPLLLRAEGADWMRLHPVAREVLRERLEKLPAEERQTLSRRASLWYAAQELYEAAAEQSFLAGDLDTAVSLVERSTQRMTVQGRSAAVLAWYQRLSPQELQQHPGFWAPVGWALAMSERHTEAQLLIDLMLSSPDVTDAKRFTADLIASTAAAFGDRVEGNGILLRNWPEAPPNADSGEVAIFQVARAFDSLNRGRPEQARLHWSRLSELDRTQAYSPVSYGFADFGVGLSHLWEGRCGLAQAGLRPALARAEERMDRRNPVACMLSALLAQACWESGQDDAPGPLLAGRLDVLSRHGLPDAIIAAYTTLAQVADGDGRQDHATELLESLRALGQARAIIRLQVAAQFELVRLHARHGRADSAQNASAQLDALLRSRRPQLSELLLPLLDLHAELARAHAALARQDSGRLAQALQAVEAAASLAASLKRGGDAVRARLLRAEILRRQGATDAPAQRTEALSLAEAGGMLRVLRDHGARQSAGDGAAEPPEWQHRPPSAALPPREPDTRGAGLLTMKEREVLTLLSRNLSNKEIALALGIGEQTIKWHVKNLLSKLNAGNRKHAVARARMLGLVGP